MASVEPRVNLDEILKLVHHDSAQLLVDKVNDTVGKSLEYQDEPIDIKSVVDNALDVWIETYEKELREQVVNRIKEEISRIE